MTDKTPPYDAKVAMKRFGRAAVLRIPQADLNKFGVALAEVRDSFMTDVYDNLEKRRPDEVMLYGDPKDILRLLQRLQEFYRQKVGDQDVRTRVTTEKKKRFVTRSLIIPTEKKRRKM